MMRYRNPEKMDEKERIDYIREHGSEMQKAGLKFIFNGNKYKPRREEMWNDRLYRGVRMVMTIQDKKGLRPPKKSKKKKSKKRTPKKSTPKNEGTRTKYSKSKIL